MYYISQRYFLLLLFSTIILVQQFNSCHGFWEDNDNSDDEDDAILSKESLDNGLSSTSKNLTTWIRGAPYDIQNTNIDNNIGIDDIKSNEIITPEDKNIKPISLVSTVKTVDDEDEDDDKDDDDDDDEDDDSHNSHENKGLESNTILTTIKTTTTTVPTPLSSKRVKNTKICVTISPEYASTRNGPLVSYECVAKICSDPSASWNNIENDDAIVVTQYQFRKPLFDWNSGYTHLFVNNGTCDRDRLTCRNKIDINVDSFIDKMEQGGYDQAEIRCVVADYIQNYESFNYVTGEESGVLKHFKGNRPHESCNSTSDCGENLICVASTIREPFNNNNNIDEDNDDEHFVGYCECTSVIQSDSMGTQSKSYILVEDEHFHEQVCVPIRSLNESCQYDQQCKQLDPNSYCRPLYTEDGIATTNMVCDCMIGYVTDRSKQPLTMDNKCYAVDRDDMDYDVSLGVDEDHTKPQPSNQKHEMVYIWWIFPPNEPTDSSNKDLHGLPFYARRYLTIRNLSYILLVLTIVIPSIIIIITLTIYYYRKMSDSNQFQPRRTSFADESDSVYFPGEPVIYPTDICNKINHHPIFEHIPVGLKVGELKQKQTNNDDNEDICSNNQKIFSKKSEDKQNLVQNDQLSIDFDADNHNSINNNDDNDNDNSKFT